MIPRRQSSRVGAISYPLAQLNLSRDSLCIIANMAELVFGYVVAKLRCLSLYDQIFGLGEVSFERGRFNAARSWSSFGSQNSFSDQKILGFLRVYFVDFCSTLNTHIIRYQHNLVKP